MFGSSPIRYLSPSEEFYAKAENFIGFTLTLRGPVDVGAMSEAFETLCQVHPVHAGHLERRLRRQAPDHGRRVRAQGIWLEKIGDTSAERLPISRKRWSICG